MGFTSIISRRHARAALFYSRREDGQALTVWFPDAPGANPSTYPNAILCQIGTVSSGDRDLMAGIDRRVRSLAISISTEDLPAVFKTSLGLEKLRVAQPVKVGYTSDTSILYLIKSASSASGITQMELDQQL